MHQDVKLSIIVPVYNVEKYVRKCIESILKQKFTAFELLLIDDGSEDKSGEICDEYALKDSRIRVFHKINEGQAAARNLGIKNAMGEYLGFVDSDDWIYEDMYSNMMEIANNNSASIICCQYDIFRDDKLLHRGGSELLEYDTETAIYKLFFPTYYLFFPWNKIFKKELFDNIEFPYGKLYEDISTIYRLFKKVERVFFSKKSGYVYRIRNNSSTGGGYSNRSVEVIEAIDYVLLDSKKSFPTIYDKMIVGYVEYYISYLNKAILGKAPELKSHYRTFKKIVRENKHHIIRCNEISWIWKAKYLLCAYFETIYRVLLVIKYKIKK